MKYRKKPAVIEAFQYDGDLKGSDGKYYVPQWAVYALKNGDMFFTDLHHYKNNDVEPSVLFVKTLEGDMEVSIGDYIIKDEKGCIQKCKDNIFKIIFKELQETEKDRNE